MKNYEKMLLLVGILLVVGVGISFAYFSARTNSKGVGVSTTATTVTKKDTTITTEGVIEFNDLDIYPGHSNISKIKVTATGDQEVLYNLIWTGTNTLNTALKYTVYKSTTNETPSITCTKHEEGSITKLYYETCTNNNFTNLGTAISTGEITSTSTEKKFKLMKNETLQATETGNTVYYYVVLEYPNLNTTQNIDMSGTFTGTASIELLEKLDITASDQILANKTISTRNDFSTTLATDTTGTIYTAPDDYGTSYYFAGSPTDNWVKFAGFYWRIIRINGDGTIRMIYQGTAANTTGTGTQTTTSAFNSSYNNNMYVGYMYTSGQVHGRGTNSTIKGVLDNWYNSNLASQAGKIATGAGATFCNDRMPYSGSGTGTSATDYAAYNRLVTNKTPSFKCTDSGDRFDTSVGLMTADELSYAGGVYGIDNSDYYLYTNQNYWTLSPIYFNGNYADVYYASSDGRVDFGCVGWAEAGVRPVINLKVDTAFADGGIGTSSNPYVVS